MTTKERQLVKVLKEVLAWNKADIKGFDDITPSMEMLEARAEVLKAAIKKAQKPCQQ